MAVSLSPIGGSGAQFFDNNGVPLTGGKLYSYEAGTTTPKTTYTSFAGTTANTNPIVLDAAGRPPSEIWLTSGDAYKFVLTTSTGTQIGTWDNIYGYSSGSADAVTEVQTATAGQTLFVLSTMAYNPGANTLGVYIDGVNQVVENAYTETSATSVTFISGLHEGAVVKFINMNVTSADASTTSYEPGPVGSVTTTVQAKLRETVSVTDFGAVGDGVTDDTAAIQNAINAVDVGGTVFLEPGKTYLHTGGISLVNKSIEMQGSTFAFTHTGNLCGIQVKGRSSIRNGAFINNGTPSGTLGPAGQRDVFCLDVHNCEYRNLVFKTGSNDYAPFNIAGDSHDVVVSGITYEAGNWDMGVIIHWATTDDSAVTDYRNITFTPSVSVPTTHPNNIRIENVNCGDFTVAGALVSGVFLSGVYDISVENLNCGNIARAITIYAGDYAGEFAPSLAVKFKLMRGISAKNITSYDITGEYGIQVDGQGTLGSLERSPVQCEITNINLRSTRVTTNYGVFARAATGLKVIGGSTAGFYRAVFLQRYVFDAVIDGLRITEAVNGGILVDTDVSTNTNIRLINNWIYNNNTGASAVAANSGIVMRNCTGCVIQGNVFGIRGGTENQFYSIYLEDTSDHIVVAENVIEKSSGSVGISAELVTQYSRRYWDGGGNASDIAFIFDPAGHVFYRSIGFGRKSAMINTASTMPTTGTWQQGDEVIFRFSTAGGWRGAVCTTAGTPGTWKQFGAIAS